MTGLFIFRKHSKIIASVLLTQLLTQVIAPTVSYALTSGPNQPEFSSFEPVATTNMVSEFSGDFTYNLPLLEVPGPQGSSYPLSLSYHSGSNQEEESSWVGYGWSLNPGAINRNTRGFPDDIKGKAVTFHNKAPKNWTVSAGVGLAPEAFGKDFPISPSANAALRYNNYRGFGYNAGVGVKMPVSKGMVSLGYNVSEQGGRPSFSLQISPASLLAKPNDEQKKETKKEKYKIGQNLLKDVKKAWSKENVSNQMKNTSMSLLSTSQHSFLSFSDFSSPTAVSKYNGVSVNFTVSFTGTAPFIPAGGSANIFGSYSSQTNVESSTQNTFGYMYSNGASANDVMDYQTEKDNGYKQTDVFVGMPFNTADNFQVSGEGIGGSFRMYHKRIGHFGPNNVTSNTEIGNIGAEVQIGLGLVGGGLDVGAGKNTNKIQDWNRGVSTFHDPESTTEDEPVFFRFSGDLGGEWGTNYRRTRTPDDQPIVGTLIPTLGGANVLMNVNQTKPNGDNRVGRTSFIGFRTHKQLNAGNTYSKLSAKIRSSIDQLAIQDQIGQFAIFNAQGLKYVYGQPVFNQNEKNLSFGVQGASASQIEKNYLVYYKNDNTKVGEESNTPYASSYLLTEITTPDYVDLDPNGSTKGPSPDDFGGYTRFTYQRVHDSYRWRMPYKGLRYSPGSHSDPMDDMGTMSSGEKEIQYLQAIETKSHVALFIMQDRDYDSFEAADPIQSINKTYSETNLKKLKKLIRIDLYSVEEYPNGQIVRNTDGTIAPPPVTVQNPSPKPVKTVHFEYYTSAESLCKKAPNGDGVGGKLTLKRVFFEYNGITRTRVSPYTFQYQYPNFSLYPPKYQNNGSDDVTGVYDQLSLQKQNPDYDELNSNAWGDYQLNGQDRYDKMKTWVDQNITSNYIDPITSEPAFDPAAWQLKVIKLPSGGEIHVQYEQDDYNFVQDQRAHVMVQLLSAPPNAIASMDENEFEINLNSIGFQNLPPSERLAYQNALVNLIKQRYIGTGKKIYFKFLYRLIGSGTPTLGSCNSDYITGYANVGDVRLSGSHVIIKISNSSLPRQICREFVKTQRLGKIDPTQECSPSVGIRDGASAEQLVMQLISLAQGAFDPGSICGGNLALEHSYFRIPTPLPKAGGGIRVKRLMMFDNGLEGNQVLYGNEYLYQTTDDGNQIISSGVAINEPVTMREENILVDFIPTQKQGFFDMLVAGENLKQTEGPVGESIYPAPMVGYSRVVVRNIHSGKTNPGFSVSEYFTAKDFPVITKMSDISPIRDYTYSPGVFANFVNDKMRVAQGFSFILNEMHGQIRRQASYSGPYFNAGDAKKLLDASKATLISEQVYEYFRPGESIPVQTSLFGTTLTETYNPGREVDVTFAQKQIVESNYDVNTEVDFSTGLIPFPLPIIIPYPTGIPTIDTFDGELSVHATTKVVRYPAIVKKTTVYQDGITHTSENVGFDINTGTPVAVKSSDEFKGAYLAQSVPASWQYPAMSAKWKSEGKKLNSGTYQFNSTGDYLTLGGGACDLAEFTPGDKIKVGTVTNLFTVTELDNINNRVKVYPNGTANASYTQVAVLFTSKTNQLTDRAGDITFFAEDASLITTPVLNPSARYDDTNPFTVALSNATKNLNSGNGAFTLAGPFTMDMSAFADKLTTCNVDITNAQVSELEYTYSITGGQLDVKLMAFCINCGVGQCVTIAADGWK